MQYEATDAPNLSSDPSTLNMFFQAETFNGDLSDWDVSPMTSLRYMFYKASAFNGDISDWDVSNVTDMTCMFADAVAFNRDLSDWDVSKVTNMNYMFFQARAFNSDISDWDVSSVKWMDQMFSGAVTFNSDISDWDVSNVTGMSAMFIGATAFNSDISDWDVSKVTNAGLIFHGATAFNRNLGPWFIILEDTSVDNGETLVADISSRVAFDTGIDSYTITGTDADDFTITNWQLVLNSASDYSAKSRYYITIVANSAEVGDFFNVDPSVPTSIRAKSPSNSAPSVISITRYNPSVHLTNSDMLQFKVTFSKTVTGVSIDDFELSPNSPTSSDPQTNPVTSVTGSGSQYYVTVASEQSGTYNLDVAQGNDIVDASNNPLSSHTPKNDDQSYDFLITTPSTPPVIAIEGSMSISVGLGSTYVDAGATCIDYTDGDISSQISVANQADTSVAKEYIVIYTCTNSTGNSANAFRIVTVLDSALSVTSITRHNPSTQTTNSDTLRFKVAFSETVTGVDTDDFELSPDSPTSSNPVTSVTGSGSQYYVTVASEQSGTYNLDVAQGNNIVDASSNSLSSRTPTGADESYTVTSATDSTPPVITLAGSSSVSVELGTTYTDAGATCSDDTDGDISSQIVTSNPVNTSVAQAYTVEYTCTDDASNSAHATRTVTVTDPAPSVISITRHDPPTRNTNSSTLQFQATFSEAVTGVGTDDFELSPDSTGGNTTTTPTNSSQFTKTSSPSLPAPARQIVFDTITVHNPGTVASVSVAVDITHADIGDLKVQLTPPDSPRKTLHDRTDGGADIDQTYTPDVGSDIEIRGKWILRILNYAYSYTGTLNSWTLTIDYTDGSTTTTTNLVTSVTGSGSQYLVTVASEQEGTYNLNVSQDNDIVDSSSNSLSSLTPTGDDQPYIVTFQTIPPQADTTDPVITLRGSSSVSVELGTTYTDAGATCSDDTDGDISSQIVTSNPVDTNVAQAYTVEYTCTDDASNSAHATRTVTVTAAADTTDPVITLRGSSSVSVVLGTTYTDAGATCSDDTDGDISSQIVTSNPVDTSVAQTYTVEYTCTDDASNSAHATRTVTVTAAADTTDPVITLRGSSSVSVVLGTTYTDAGATCSDDTDGDISSQIVTSNPVDTSVAQTYTVEYTCTDSSGQSASPVTRTVIVLDSARSVGTVTLTSNTTGTIHVEWNESIETPMEYRVAWTKIDDGFKSLKDPDWNAYPTDSEYTITDLEEGEEYKVKVRAKFDTGKRGGPWSDVFTIIVER